MESDFSGYGRSSSDVDPCADDGSGHHHDYYDERRDKLYCGEGLDEYVAVKNDYVDSSCEKKVSPRRIFGGEA